MMFKTLKITLFCVLLLYTAGNSPAYAEDTEDIGYIFAPQGKNTHPITAATPIQDKLISYGWKDTSPEWIINAFIEAAFGGSLAFIKTKPLKDPVRGQQLLRPETVIFNPENPEHQEVFLKNGYTPQRSVYKFPKEATITFVNDSISTEKDKAAARKWTADMRDYFRSAKTQIENNTRLHITLTNAQHSHHKKPLITFYNATHTSLALSSYHVPMMQNPAPVSPHNLFMLDNMALRNILAPNGTTSRAICGEPQIRVYMPTSRQVNICLYNALGLPNLKQTNNPAYSGFMLRLLYDDRIKTGMTAEELRMVLPEVIKDAQTALQQPKNWFQKFLSLF